MELKISRKPILLVLTFLFVELANGQTKSKTYFKDSRISFELNNIEFDVSKSLRILASELKSFNFNRIGAAFGTVGKDIDCEFRDVEVEIINSNTDGEPDYSGLAEKTKRVVKSYLVDKDDKLAINNQYGKVAIQVWSKNEIKVEVEIKAFESSDNDALRLLESVNIAESRVGNTINFKTIFEKTSVNFRSLIKNGKEEKRGLQVNYLIYMPARNALAITNTYGSIEMDNFSGPVDVSSTYGSFSAGQLDHPDNKVKVAYGSAIINNFSNGDLSVTYGSLKLNEADNIKAKIMYSNAKILNLINGGSFSLAYSNGFKIDAVDENVKNLTINAAYSSLTLGFDEAADFDFEVTVSYAGFNYTNNRITAKDMSATSVKSRGWNPTKNYIGRLGKGSDSRIIIKSNYGNVKFL